MDRKLTVLFADVSGSAKLYERLGDAEADRAVDRCMTRMQRAIEGFDGRLVKAVGDEMMAVFASAENACQAAIEMQQRVSALPPVSGAKLAIRVGFHLGPATVEEGGDVGGDTVDSAARVVGLAKSDQILASKEAVAELPGHLRELSRECGLPPSKSGRVAVLEVRWHHVVEPVATTRPPASPPKPARPTATAKPATAESTAAKLCIRYRGRAYLLDEGNPIMSLGRDSGNDVFIDDRKASRHHGRIERRAGKYFYVDRSTNGSYVVLGRMQETMVRHTEILLQGSGSICFGTSVNDPVADCATFEHL